MGLSNRVNCAHKGRKSMLQIGGTVCVGLGLDSDDKPEIASAPKRNELFNLAGQRTTCATATL